MGNEVMDYKIIRKILRDSLRVDSIDYEKTKILTLAHDNDRSLPYQGKFYSPLVDTIQDDLSARGVKCVSIARIISRIKGDVSYGNARSPEGGFARALIGKRIKQLMSRGTYAYSNMEERVWSQILDVTGAEKVVGILPSRELCVACRKRGIWVADVQHGVIADTHTWYGESYRGTDPVEYLPHEFLVWDHGSADVIDNWAAPKGVHSRVIGNRWVARFAGEQPRDAMAQELVQKFEQDLQADDSRKTILVALSWGDYNIPNGFMVEGLENVIRKTSDKYRWLIRLHPNQLRGFRTHESGRFFDYFEQRLRGHAEWEAATVNALPAVLARVDLHVSWMSSVCMEAAQMGIRSALMNPRLREADDIGDFYQYYKDRGMVDLIREEEADIGAWVDRNIGNEKAPENYQEYDARYEELLNFLVDDGFERRAVS